jgi:hypothetical protein
VQTGPFPSSQSTQLAAVVHSLCEQSASTVQVPPTGTTPGRFELDEDRLLELDEEAPPELLPLLSVAGGRS